MCSHGILYQRSGVELTAFQFGTLYLVRVWYIRAAVTSITDTIVVSVQLVNVRHPWAIIEDVF